MPNAMEGGIFAEMEQIEHIINLGFNPKALKQLWKAISNSGFPNKEELFEKATFQMLNRCFPDWMQ